MSPRGVRLLWALIALGLGLRLAWAFTTYGVGFDVDAYSVVRGGLHDDPLHVYGDFARWPYPPGYFLWVLAAGGLEGLTNLSFSNLIQLPPIFADLAIAFVVQHALGRRGASERIRLAAAALVALGPSFLVVSGFHGQIDSIAILPALLGVLLWTRTEHRQRAVAVGLLIGLGGVLKTVPLVAVLGLLPWARSWREGAVLLASAAALPILAFLPFAVADPGGVLQALRYRGVPGVGGISLVAQPELARVWMNEILVDPSGLTLALLDVGGAITAAALLAGVAFLFRFRPGPVEGAAFVYVLLWVFGVNFFLQYVVWGFPFLLIAGFVREVAAAQALMLPAIVLVYLRPWESEAAAWIYAPTAIGMWVASVIGLIALAGRIAGAPRALEPPALAKRAEHAGQ